MSLAEQHRQAQLALRAQTLRQLLAIWPAFDIRNIDESWLSVQASLSALIWLRHRQSADLAAGYYQLARRTAGVSGRFQPITAEAPSAEYLDRALGYVGTIVPKKLVAAGRQDAAKQTLVWVAGTVGRLVLNGGRDTITESVQADPEKPGWERVAGGNACDFCSFLADRGAVYGEESADFESHDHCACSAEPVWGTSQNPNRDTRVRDRTFTPEQRQVRNERVRAAIAERRS